MLTLNVSSLLEVRNCVKKSVLIIKSADLCILFIFVVVIGLKSKLFKSSNTLEITIRRTSLMEKTMSPNSFALLLRKTERGSGG